MDQISKDDRFSKITKDPRFRRIPKKERKVQIDKRFKDMFTDKKFKLKYSVDKRGRPINSTTNENFRKYYDISDSEEEENESDKKPDVVETETVGQSSKSSGRLNLYDSFIIILSHFFGLPTPSGLPDAKFRSLYPGKSADPGSHTRLMAGT